MSKLADRLIAKSLIVRTASPHDGRAQTLGLTARGTKFVPELATLADQNEAGCFAHLSAKDRTTLERILKETAARLGVTAIPSD